MRWFLCSLGLLLAIGRAGAQSADDQYIRIYGVIQEADGLSTTIQSKEALAKYREAQDKLQSFAKGFPDWNPGVVKFRLNYISGRIATLSQGGTIPPPPKAPAIAPTVSRLPVRDDSENQLSVLRDQVRLLQADKQSLEAKLKEALALQPAAVDPRELAKAEERIRALQKENELLKVSVEQAKNKPALESDTRALEQAQKDLAEANLKVTALQGQNETLEKTRKELELKVQAGAGTPGQAAATEALNATRSQATEQGGALAKLTAERDALQAKVKTLTAEAETAAALRQENEILKKQLAGLQSGTASSMKGGAEGQLVELQARLAALQSENEILRLEKRALQDRVKALSPADSAAPGVGPQSSIPAFEDPSRIRKLERERDQLLKKLEDAKQDLAARKRKGGSAQVRDLEEQLAALRMRLDVYEQQRAPFTPEELVLVKQPEPKLAEAAPAKQRPQEVPPGTAVLVAEAQRQFVARDFEKAQQAYLDVLKRDENNTRALGNLAVIEIELKKYDEAEKHIQQALKLSPDDPFSLSVLGQIRYAQNQYDAALESLSRAAKLDPDSAPIQNYLGSVLMQKGMRGPAESSLRRAIQLQPGYGDAHYNLAVIYSSQKPPLNELARWHYEKAVTAGHARNDGLEKTFSAPASAQ